MKPSLLKFPPINSMKESGRYFDGSGNPHYYVTDWHGNNIAVVDRNGLLEQRTRSGGLNEYRFPARDYVPGFPRFATIDPMCEVRPHQSPYLYCGGNPVMNTDPTGMLWSDEQEAQRLRDMINSRIENLKTDITENNKKLKKT